MCVCGGLVPHGGNSLAQTLLVVCNGYWGNRCTDVARRQGVLVEQVVGEWGTAVDPALIAERVREVRPSALFVTHGESSTGVCQPLTGLGEACREVGALLIVDAVVTLGGVPLMMDEWKVWKEGADCPLSLRHEDGF